jgi:alpha-glucosidase
MNEPSEFTLGTVPSTLPAAGDGAPATMAELHNVYGLLEARATYEGMRRSGSRPFLLSRAAAAGSQRYTAVWTGDAPSTWTTLGMTLPALLNLGLSGMPIAGSDVGGYSGRAESSGELFARWTALGAVSPLFRAHAEKDARRQEPWAFGVDVEDAVRALIGVRYELLPYLYSVVAEASRSGEPVLSPLVYHFEDDATSRGVGDEAMLGPWVLTAPVVTKGATARSVYLPPGRWFDAYGGAVVEGGRTIDVSTAPDALPLVALPLFVREGGIVPRSDLRQWTSERPTDPLYLDAWPGAAASSFVLYDDDGASLAHESGAFARVTFTIQRTTTGATVRASAREGSFVPPKRTLVVRVRPVDRPVTAATLDGTPAAYHWDANDRSATVTLDDRAPFELNLTFDPTLAAEPTRVRVPIRVNVPPGTPETTPISVAVSSSGWAHVPLTRAPGALVAQGEIDAPRGAWLLFKVTRGSWATVEKGVGCVERMNRGAPARALPGVEVTVSAWADRCP